MSIDLAELVEGTSARAIIRRYATSAAEEVRRLAATDREQWREAARAFSGRAIALEAARSANAFEFLALASVDRMAQTQHQETLQALRGMYELDGSAFRDVVASANAVLGLDAIREERRSYARTWSRLPTSPAITYEGDIEDEDVLDVAGDGAPLEDARDISAAPVAWDVHAEQVEVHARGIAILLGAPRREACSYSLQQSVQFVAHRAPRHHQRLEAAFHAFDRSCVCLAAPPGPTRSGREQVRAVDLETFEEARTELLDALASAGMRPAPPA